MHLNGKDTVCFTYLGVLPLTPPFGYAVFCILVPRMWGSCHIPKCVALSLSLSHMGQRALENRKAETKYGARMTRAGGQKNRDDAGDI